MCLREIHDGITISVKSLTRVVMESFREYFCRHSHRWEQLKVCPWPRGYCTYGKTAWSVFKDCNRLMVSRRVMHELPTSAATLCDVFEYTCGFLIVSMSYQRIEVTGMAALHDVILPLAWLQIHLETPKRDEHIDYTSVFCDPLFDMYPQDQSTLQVYSNFTSLLCAKA